MVFGDGPSPPTSEAERPGKLPSLVIYFLEANMSFLKLGVPLSPRNGTLAWELQLCHLKLSKADTFDTKRPSIQNNQ